VDGRYYTCDCRFSYTAFGGGDSDYLVDSIDFAFLGEAPHPSWELEGCAGAWKTLAWRIRLWSGSRES
jgi:hypothetical protein